MSTPLPPLAEDADDWFVIDSPYPTLFTEPVQQVSEHILHCQGRFFLRSQLLLPLEAVIPAIKIVTWVEISRLDSSQVVDLQQAQGNQELIIIGRLAADIPGYEGVIGAESTVSYQLDGPGVVSDIVDQRLPRGEASVEQLETIAESIRGTALRDQEHQIIAEQAEGLFGRSTYQIEVPPPAGTGLTDAGIIVVAPPIDTGDSAQLMTVGSSDIVSAEGLPEPEIITELINPAEETIRCFGDFNFVSRIHPGILTPGSMIGEVEGIPGSSGMKAWILWYPELENDRESPEIELNNGIPILQAFPIYEQEMNFALQEGPEVLIDLILGADYSDLYRQPLV